MIKRILAIIILILLLTPCFAQDKIKIKKEKEKESPKEKPISRTARKKAVQDSIKNIRRSYTLFSYDVYYGYKAFSRSFYDQLNKINAIGLASPPKIIGFGFSNYSHFVASGRITMHMFFSYYLKSKIILEDTLSSDLQGFCYHFGFGKILRSRNYKFCVTLNLGFNTGQLRLNLPENIKQSNGFFSPKIGIQPKIRIGKRIFISLIMEYEKDVSKVSWKEINSKGLFSLRGLDQTGVISMISLGIVP